MMTILNYGWRRDFIKHFLGTSSFDNIQNAVFSSVGFESLAPVLEDENTTKL